MPTHTLPFPCRIAVIGGDRRMLYAAERLSEIGATVTRFALGTLPTKNSELPEAHSLFEATEDADVLLLPLPASRDGVTVNCPFAPESPLLLSDIGARMRARPALRLFGGKLPATFRAMCSALPDHGSTRITDYYEDEGLTLRNAALTAEGALILAGQKTDSALRGTTAAIIGYGRIGKLLSRLLLQMGMEVTVCARRPEVLQWAEIDGCHTIRMGDSRVAGGLFPLCCGHPIIFNTVPEPVLGRELLLRLEPNTLLIDLASPPFGATEENARAASEQNGLCYIRAPGIPGTYAPRSAGMAIADCIADRLRTAGSGAPTFPSTKGESPL